MTKTPTLIVLLLQLLCTLLEVPGQQSPCPEYFKYVIDSATNETMGLIQIRSPPKTDKLYLKVALSVAIALPTDYVGKVELAQSKEDIIRIIQHSKPLLYHLRFPLRQPVPLLTGMWFNSKQYCSGPRALGNIVTSIILEHTLTAHMSRGRPKDVLKTSCCPTDVPWTSQRRPLDFLCCLGTLHLPAKEATLALSQSYVFSLYLSQWSAAESEFITSHFGDSAAGTHINLQDITSTELTNYQ